MPHVNLSGHPDPTGSDLEIFIHHKGFLWDRGEMVFVPILARETVSIYKIMMV